MKILEHGYTSNQEEQDLNSHMRVRHCCGKSPKRNIPLF